MHINLMGRGGTVAHSSRGGRKGGVHSSTFSILQESHNPCHENNQPARKRSIKRTHIPQGSSKIPPISLDVHECVIQKIQTKPTPMGLDKNGPRIEYSRWSGSYEAHAHSSALYQNRKNDSQTAQPTSDMVSIEFATENPDLLGVGRIPLTPRVFAPGREPF